MTSKDLLSFLISCDYILCLLLGQHGVYFTSLHLALCVYVQFVCLTKVAVEAAVVGFALCCQRFFPVFLYFFIFSSFFFFFVLYVAKLQNVESRLRIKYVEKQLAGVTKFPYPVSPSPRPFGLSTNALLLEFLHWVRALNIKSQWKIPTYFAAKKLNAFLALHTCRRAFDCAVIYFSPIDGIYPCVFLP